MTDLVPPSSLSQEFQVTLIFDAGFKFALVLALSHRNFSHNHSVFAVRKTFLESLANYFMLAFALECHSTEKLIYIFVIIIRRL